MTGVTGQSAIFINNSGNWTELASFEEFNINLKQNQISEFSIKVSDIEDSDKLYVIEGAEILFMYNDVKILKGRIQKITYSTAYECEITGYGMEAVLLDKEFIKSNENRVQYTNASAQTIAKELLSQNSDGSTPWIMTPDSGGIFATDYGQVSMRYEYANRLSALAKLAEALDYEWAVNQSVDPFSTDYFELAPLLPSTTRATVSQGAFSISGLSANCSQTSKEKDITNISNKINGLGYGDGINQISTSTYNASAIYTTLGVNIDNNDTTITLTNATSFAASGEIRIMEERIIYTGKSGNNLTGCARGANSTTAREHRAGVFVEKYVAISSAEVGSSIEVNGQFDETIINKDILDISTLELVISRELIKKMNPIVRIKVIPDEPEETVGAYKIGDMVTITDSESDLDDDFRIVAINFSSYYGDLSIEIECSNRTLTFIEQMAEERKQSEALGKYMQGSTNIYAINESDNCDNTFPLNMKFYIPDDAIAINKVKLNITTEKYRADSKSITAAPVSQINSSIWAAANHASIHVTGASYGIAQGVVVSDNVSYNGGGIGYYVGTNSSFTGSLLLGNSSGPSSAKYLPFSTSTWSNIDNVLYNISSYSRGYWTSDSANPDIDIGYIQAPNLSGTFDIIRISFSYYHGTITSRAILFVLQRSPDGSSWTDVNPWNTTLSSGETYNGTIDESSDYRGYYYRLIVSGSYVNDLLNVSTCVLNVGTYISTTSNLNYGIYEDAFPTGSPTLAIAAGIIGDEDPVTGSPFSITDGGTQEVDITTAVRTVGAGNWCNIKFTPQSGTNHNRVRIRADAYVKLFIESTT
jgi:hypothetical protein